MHKKHIRQALLTAATLLVAPATGAQGIYRCGNSYSQQACAGGAAVPASDTRSAAQGAQTTQAAARDARLADTMEKARLKEEARSAPGYVGPARTPAEPEPPSASSPLAKPKIPAHFTAVAPAKPGEAPAAGKKKAKKKKKA